MWLGKWKRKEGEIIGLSGCHCNSGGCGNDGLGLQDFCWPLQSWHSDNWRVFFRCKVLRGIKIRDLTHIEAHKNAMDICVNSWRNAFPPQIDTPDDQCALCGLHTPALVPVLGNTKHTNGKTTHIWLHPECISRWNKIGHEKAMEQINEILGSNFYDYSEPDYECCRPEEGIGQRQSK